MPGLVTVEIGPDDASALGWACRHAADTWSGSETPRPRLTLAEATRLETLYRCLGSAFEALALVAMTQGHVPIAKEAAYRLEAAQDRVFAGVRSTTPAPAA